MDGNGLDGDTKSIFHVRTFAKKATYVRTYVRTKRERRTSVDGERAWTENKRGRSTSVDGEHAWTENKRGRRISVDGE